MIIAHIFFKIAVILRNNIVNHYIYIDNFSIIQKIRK